MDQIIYQQKFKVTKVIDCSKSYDLITRVEMASPSATAILDVNHQLFAQICNENVETDVTICCAL